MIWTSRRLSQYSLQAHKNVRLIYRKHEKYRIAN